jgi:hypothetical protein
MSVPRRDAGARDGASAWLILRRGGGLWGVRHDTLRELAGSGSDRLPSSPPAPQGVLHLATGETLVADELLSLAAGLEARPFPRCLRRFFPETVFGLAVWRKRPVILLAPGAFPPCLRAGSGTSEKPEDVDEFR